MSAMGTLAVELITRLDLAVPEHVDYIKDWAGVVAGHLTDYPVQRLEEQITAKEALRPKFREHLTVATTIGAPVTGPLGAIPAAAVAAGWLTRDEALEFAFTGLEFAVLPGDRKKWAEILSEELAATDGELLAQGSRLFSLISTAEAPMVELLGLRILPHLEGDQWNELALVMSYATTAKTLVAVLQAISKNAEPTATAVTILSPRIEELTAHKNARVAKLSKELLDAWGQKTTTPEPKEPSSSFVWNPYPGFQEPDRVRLPEPVSVETITPLLLYVRNEDNSNIHTELFWAQLVQLCQSDVATARRAVAGLNNNALLQAWSQGKQIPHPSHPDTTKRKSYYPVEARNSVLLMSLGSQPVPCLLSQPSFADMSIDPEDLLAHLEAYVTTDGAEVMLPDLLLALARLRIPEEDLPALQDKFRAVILTIEGISRTAGEVVADLPSGSLRRSQGPPVGRHHLARGASDTCLSARLCRPGRIPRPCLAIESMRRRHYLPTLQGLLATLPSLRRKVAPDHRQVWCSSAPISRVTVPHPGENHPGI